MALRIIAAEEQLRMLKLSVQTLSKFGSQTVMEARPGCLHLRSVNHSKSAYVRMTFASNFFDVYELFHQNLLTASVLSKSLVASLKTQRVCRAIFEVFTQTNKLVVFIDCENGLQKKFEFDLIDSDALQAEINFDLYPVRITAEPGELSKLLASFQQSLDEVTVIAIPDSATVNSQGGSPNKSCQIHSFYDPLKIDLDNFEKPLLHTQLSMNAHHHFLEYQHSGRETVDATFNMKDFKAVLNFCASSRNNLTILFSKAGDPVAIVPIPMHEHMHSTFSSEFVLATMMDTCVGVDGEPLSLLNKTNAGNRAVRPAGPQASRGGTGGDGLNGRRDLSMATGAGARSSAAASFRTGVRTNDVAADLVAMNAVSTHQHSAATATGGRPSSKRLKSMGSQNTSATVSIDNFLDDRCDVDGEDGDDDDDDEEVPGTPPHERRIDTCIQNWS